MHPVQVTQAVAFCPAFSDGKKITGLQQARLWAVLSEEPACPSRRVLEKMTQRYAPVPIGMRHVNRLRAKWGLSCGKGRPRGTPSATMAESGGALMKLTPQVLGVGVHLFAAWTDGQEIFGQVVSLLQHQIQAYREAHPGVDFPLLHHKEETLLRRFQALFYGPLFGIEKLTEFDVKEHALDTLIGRSYQSSTLNQFLGQLERLDAGEALLPALVPADAEEPGEPGRICYVDGHMIAFWTKASMHKGKITMLGRIMAGSQAVIAHNQRGQAVFVAYYAPDIRMSRMIVDRYSTSPVGGLCPMITCETGISVPSDLSRAVSPSHTPRSMAVGIPSSLIMQNAQSGWASGICFVPRLSSSGQPSIPLPARLT